MNKIAENWYPSREAALSRLNDFVPRAGRSYQSHRNEDLGEGQHKWVSGLSPYFRYGLLEEAEVIKAVLAQHSAEAANKFIEEVSWRSYWQGWMMMHPQIWLDYHSDVADRLTSMQQDIELAERYHNACQGQTGIDCFDSWSREMQQTGYLHNHARMWFASIWIFTLQLPWQLGADLFMRRMLDGDSSSNTLSWRSVAGLHTRGKHYVATAENIRRFTHGRFNPVGQLNEQAESMYEITMRPAVREIPAAGEVHGRVGILATEAFCNLNGLVEAYQPVALGVLDTTEARSPGSVSQQVSRFSQGALLNLTECSPQPLTLMQLATLETQFCEWVQSHQLDSVLLLGVYPGIHQLVISQMIAGLPEGSRPHICYHQSEWQRALWPHAQAGFYKFRQQLPALLERLSAT